MTRRSTGGEHTGLYACNTHTHTQSNMCFWDVLTRLLGLSELSSPPAAANSPFQPQTLPEASAIQCSTNDLSLSLPLQPYVSYPASVTMSNLRRCFSFLITPVYNQHLSAPTPRSAALFASVSVIARTAVHSHISVNPVSINIVFTVSVSLRTADVCPSKRLGHKLK